MYEHDWHWKRALLAGVVAPLGSAGATAVLYWVISLLYLNLAEGSMGDDSLFVAGVFLDTETLLFMTLGTGMVGLAVMLVLGTPIGYALSKMPRFSKAGYIATSFMAFPVMIVLISNGGDQVLIRSIRDLYFLGYFALITILNGWIAHWVIHGSRKRPPERVEAVFE